MRNKQTSNFLWVVFGGIFILNLIQIYFTELLPDEAYYWVYSQHLDWGYFDHPPMIALFIKISSIFFDNELGVRFFSAISLLLTGFFTWKIVYNKENHNEFLFVALFFSMALINAYGFIATPDTALVLFTSLLLLGYKRYLKDKSWSNYLIISIAVAGMLYSKYQAFLIVVCLLISNPKMLRDGRMWFTGILTVALFLPHILWQFENDFPSFRYHLYERVANRRYKFEHTLMHFVNMIAIVGVTFPIIYKAFFKNIRSKDVFTKGLVFIVFGFFGLFFFSSFRGRVQAQWLVPITFPLLIITYQYFVDKSKSKKWLYRLATINFVILLIVRASFAFPSLSPVQLDTHHNKAWVNELKANYPKVPKFFVNSYQNVATYWYYSGEQPYYYQNFTGRKNHFTLLQKNQSLNFNSVLFANRGRTKSQEIAFKGVGKDSIYLQKLEKFLDPSILKFEWKTKEENIQLKLNNKIDGVLTSYTDKEFNLNDFQFEIGLRHKKQRGTLTIPAIINLEKIDTNNSEGVTVSLTFSIPDSVDLNEYNAIGIGIKSISEIEIYRISELRLFTFTP